MDKKMMDKVNEMLKANGKRELSLDEMDKVSGGGDGGMWNELLGNEEKINWFVYELMAGIEENFGRDVCATYINDMFHDNYLNQEYLSAGLDGLHNKLCQVAVDESFTNYDGNLFW